MAFSIALTNVLLTLFYIVPGFIVRRLNKTLPEHLPGISGILIYIGTPFLIVSAFLNIDYTPELAVKMGIFFLLSFAVQCVFMLAVHVLYLRKHREAEKRFLSIGMIMGNVGFFGLPLITALMPGSMEVSAYVTMYMTSMNIIAFTFGIYCLTGEKKYVSLKQAFLNPTFTGLLIALPIFFFGLGRVIPETVIGAVNSIAKMTTPLCMFVLGVRLASTRNTKAMFSPVTIASTIGKMIVFPLFCFAVCYFLPLDTPMFATLVILSGMPCAAIILSLAEMHKQNPDIPANCILLSTLISFVTIPLLSLLVL